ncbi:MAG: class I SAM-dependent methyltransferase [Blastocatellia bacterium]
MDASELITPEMQRRLQEIEDYLKISVALHREDLLFKFYLQQSPGVAGVNHYFASGAADAQKAAETLKLLLRDVQQPKVLEFAAGFGRVSRHMPSRAPGLDLTVSDVHGAAVQFAKEILGLHAFKSEPLPNQAVIEHDRYDFIFTLSFFSHIPDSSFGDWLLLLYAALRPGGFLLFTTHGEASMKKYEHLANLYNPKAGFGYTVTSDQPDIEGENYGTMSVDFEYVVRQIRRSPARIVQFQSAGWFGHQDEWIIQKPLG